jgi:hypothetical protein
MQIAYKLRKASYICTVRKNTAHNPAYFTYRWPRQCRLVMVHVEKYIAELASMIPAEEVLLGGRRIRFCRVDDEQSLTMALCALQLDGDDATGLALRLCELYGRRQEVLVYVAEDVLRVGYPVDVLVENEPMPLYLARNYSLAQLHQQGERAGQCHATWQTAASSRRCTDIWKAIMLLA